MFTEILLLFMLAFAFYNAIYEGFIVLPPYWNIPTRHTRGMSYDIRGDVPIPSYDVGPWNNSSWAPVSRMPEFMRM